MPRVTIVDADKISDDREFISLLGDAAAWPRDNMSKLLDRSCDFLGHEE
jgi:hypothetical protein